MKGALVVLAGLVVIGMIIGMGYNSLVRANTDVKVSWADLEATYQRRVDLVNQSLPTVIAGAAQELAVFTALRDQAAALSGAIAQNAEYADVARLVSGFDQAYLNFTAYAADNPEIVSAQLFSDLMVEIEGTENRINVARRDYNESVKRYLNRTQMFPGNLFAGMFGFSPDAYMLFEATSPGAENAPQIVFPTPAAP